jgi:hypothetical protein
MSSGVGYALLIKLMIFSQIRIDIFVPACGG